MRENKSVKKAVGARIQKLRKAKGYTQLTFSEKVGLSKNYLSDIECGKSSVKLDKLVTIINQLECSADDIFIDVIHHGYKVKTSRLAERLEKLSLEDQEKAFELLEVFINNSK